MDFIKRFSRNTRGTDYAIGDIHGHFTEVLQKLKEVGFDASKDRLFPVGDLVDRGPHSYLALEWIKQKWVHSVMGNHDVKVAKYGTESTGKWLYNAGKWFTELSEEERLEWSSEFSQLPIVIEVETQKGLIGIMHASPQFKDWNYITSKLSSRIVRNDCMHSRVRIRNNLTDVIENIDYVVCGHEQVPVVKVLGNVYHIDTGGHKPNEGGYFTLLNLNTLEVL